MTGSVLLAFRPIDLCFFVVADYLEEQECELETLQCIYAEGELTKISSNPTCFQVHVEPASVDEEGCSGE